MTAQLTLGLGASAAAHEPVRSLGPGVTLLSGFALPSEAQLLRDIESVIRESPLRHMVTPGGLRMSVAMTNCGTLGWVSDARGYRYDRIDPERGQAWPAMPEAFRALATEAAAKAGFRSFAPDACLVNRYEPGTRLTLHQDRNERDFDAPIVSVSLGLPATFLLGGDTRKVRPTRVPLVHGDVLVWGGPARLRFHGVSPIADGVHETLGPYRFNLTLRKAG